MLNKLSSLVRGFFIGGEDMKNLAKTAFEQIYAEEGFREKPYYCTEGFPTIGIGFRIGNKGEPLPDRVMFLAEAQVLLEQKIESAEEKLQRAFPVGWLKCNLERKVILISMYFQLGLTGISNFRKMWAAINAGDFVTASAEMLDSRWAKQTPRRAYRQAEVMRSGTLEVYAKEGYKNVRVY